MKKTILVLLGLVIIGASAWFLRGESEPAVTVPSSGEVYRSERFGVSFVLPAGYFAQEIDDSTGERTRFAIVLMEDTQENRDLVAGKDTLGREAPPTITIGVFQNNLDGQSAEQFVKESSFSNFKLSNGVLTETVVGGEAGLRYGATGLYENENVVVARPEFVYMFTGFYNAKSDPIFAHFEQVLKSVEFLKPEVPAEVVITCDEKRAEMCAQVYAPVCATVMIQCIKAPCYPIKETFSNACEACRNSLVPSYVVGICKEE